MVLRAEYECQTYLIRTFGGNVSSGGFARVWLICPIVAASDSCVSTWLHGDTKRVKIGLRVANLWLKIRCPGGWTSSRMILPAAAASDYLHVCPGRVS